MKKEEQTLDNIFSSKVSEHHFSHIDMQGNPQSEAKPYTWSDVLDYHSARVIKTLKQKYPETEHRQAYEKKVYLLSTGWIQGKNQSHRYILFKRERQMKRILKEEKLKDDEYEQKTDHQSEQGSSAKYKVEDIKGIFKSMKDKISQKSHQIVEKFMEVELKDNHHIKVLGRFKVGLAEVGGLRNFLTNTICYKCKRSSDMYITISTEAVLLSSKGYDYDNIEECIPFTKELQVQYKDPEIDHFKFTAKLTSGRSQYRLIFEDLPDLFKFSCVIEAAWKRTEYFKSNEFNSFSPRRQNCWARFYSDGKEYFSDLHDEIENAQRKICMTGWCITPYFLLKRPESIEHGESRLDRTLIRAANRGVKVFILVFQEPSLIVNNDSYNVFQIFESAHENFKVVRHPGLIIPQMWSHHEKSVIIDEKVAFMGGLDICYGRWDDHSHSIVDIPKIWDGADYNNEKLRGITEPRQYKKSNLDRSKEPRMGWHDIAIQVRGPSVTDIQRHFVQYWYFALRDLSDDPRDHLVNFKNRYQELKRRNRLRAEQEKNNKAVANQVERMNGVNTEDDSHMKELCRNSKLDDEQQEQLQAQYCESKQEDPKDFTLQERFQSAKQAFEELLQRKNHSTSREIYVEGISTDTIAGSLEMNLCRSSCNWSTGIKRVENSIQNAYYTLIDNSKELIYIENQFFMSHANLISEKIAARIKRAHQQKKQFKVIVVMPLLPGFQGDITDEKSGVLRVQMQIQYEAISRHESSIYQILQRQAPELKIEDYIYFFGLRGHGLIGEQKDTPVTQIIYVHSKLMIVDDERMIIGSANINDRSLIGNRDSELAMITTDRHGRIGKGEIFEFRSRVFQEHFGMPADRTRDMNGYWEQLKKISKNNTVIYREVFGCSPDDTVTRAEQVKQLAFKHYLTKQKYEQKIPGLVGHYCDFPTDFLKEEDLSLKLGQNQFIMPITMFT